MATMKVAAKPSQSRESKEAFFATQIGDAALIAECERRGFKVEKLEVRA
ncbi:MAG: hypothetical protein M9932_01835 [Xanthobacteraceae bacterium]|nr:hypothetical protein [Xanthobacteraceae bacterium]